MIHLDRNQINLVLVEFIFQIGRSRSFFSASASARHRSWFYPDPSRCDVQLELAAVSTRRQKNQQKPNRPTEDVRTWGRASVHAAHAAELTPLSSRLQCVSSHGSLIQPIWTKIWFQLNETKSVDPVWRQSVGNLLLAGVRYKKVIFSLKFPLNMI